MMLLMLTTFAPAASAAPIDMGPTYGKDYSGMDYNVTEWHSPASKSANHYEAVAKECAAVCDADPFCCSWTYCPPGSGAMEFEGKIMLGERCCLKGSIPQEHSPSPHWTGVPAHAVKDGKETEACLHPKPRPPPPPTPIPYPGPDYTHPKIHQSPDCLHRRGWHDMAGALTFKGVHHAFQGCPASGGWSHSRSVDLVHWENLGRGVHELHETYEGMDSLVTPCSGFAVVDDKGVPCAGFRQCGSSKGTTGLNPAAHKWDVPMEIRCATNANLTKWGDPEYIYPLYFYRSLPYDPVRPWKEVGPGGDKKWYSSWSTDGCNKTGGDGTQHTPCKPGGQLELLSAPTLRGPWTQLPPMFTTNVTCSAGQCKSGAIEAEFVTSGYFGGLAGDPDGGSTRVVTQNRAGATYWVGTQKNGGKFEALWDKVGAVGHYDYGSLTMARTLGSDSNQVALNGRRVLLGWIGGGSPASQSLARDLSLSTDYELLQAFVPELQVLRMPSSHTSHEFDGDASAADTRHPSAVRIGGSQQLEVVASFTWTASSNKFGVSVLGGAANLTIDCSTAACQGQVNGKGGPLMPLQLKSVSVHAIVDGSIIEVIYNNRTAMVVYATPPSADAKAVSLFGTGAGVKGTIETWSLKQANNFGPQP